MSFHRRPRPAALSGSNESERKPIPNVRPIENYRVMQGQKIRQYYSVGDPIQHAQSATNLLILGIAFVGLIGIILLVWILINRP